VRRLKESRERESPRSGTCVGGTFDILHDGHRELLGKAAEASNDEILLVGITSDELAASGRSRKVRKFSERADAVSIYLKRLGCRFEIVEIHDFSGPAATEAGLDTIVVSSDTRENAERINLIRKEKGLAALRIISIDLVCGEDGVVLSSTLLAEKSVVK